MKEIDWLEGEELAMAVARALGAEQGQSYPLWRNGQCIDTDAFGHKAQALVTYRPDLYIAQAHELDDDGWLWQTREYIGDAEIRGNPNPRMLDVELDIGDRIIYVVVNLAGFPTKGAAYATARCRAFLKAKAAMG